MESERLAEFETKSTGLSDAQWAGARRIRGVSLSLSVPVYDEILNEKQIALFDVSR